MKISKVLTLGFANVLKQILVIVIIFSLMLQSIFCSLAMASLSNIIPDGTTNTTTEASPNNITVVNIATPLPSGTSMNNFSQFDVNQSGAVVNNSAIVANTQLGGWVYGNPHLANGIQASVIVSEVTGNMPSNLLGYLEIAGGKAEFVLLNPNGISCAGCGFINVGNLTLASGVGAYNEEGNLASINMGAGNFAVSGSGLDANLVDYFRIISKKIQLSAPIWAKDELAIYQGSGNFNNSSKIFSNNLSSNSSQNINIGIDVAEMGGIYAGKATLVASDLGLGVNIAGDVIASAQGIIITANGDIVYNNVASATTTNITASNNGNITQNGSLKSLGGNANLSAKNITIAGNTISSAGDVTIVANGNITNSNNLSLLANNLVINSAGDTTLQNLDAKVSGQAKILANKLLLSNSNLATTKNFTANVVDIINLDNTIISTNADANLTTKDLSLMASLISAEGTITQTASGDITQDASKTIATKAITINANSLLNSNSSLIQTANALNITLAVNLINSNSSSIAASSNALITSLNGTNSTNSYIASGSKFIGSFSGALKNFANLLAFDSIVVNNLNNQGGYLESGTSVLITNNNFALNNAGGLIQANGGNVTIDSNYQFSNTNGKINSADDIIFNIRANQNYQDLNSKINAEGDIYLNSAGYDISEGSGVKFQTANLFQVNALNFTNNANIKVGIIDLALSNSFTNNASLVSTANSQYLIRRNIVNNGTIASGSSLLLQGVNIANNNVGGSTGLVYSTGNAEIIGSGSIANNANSAIVTKGSLRIYADILISNGSNAEISSVGDLTLAGYGNDSLATFNNGSSNGAAYLKSRGNMQISANQINNIGKDNATLTEGNAYNVANVNYGDYPPMDSSKMMSEEVATNILTSNNSQIIASGSLLINGNILNQTADILAGNNLIINGNVTNNVTHFTTRSLNENWANTYEDCWSSAMGGLFCSTEHDSWNAAHTNTFSSLTPSRIAAGVNLTISGSQISNDNGTAVFQNNTPLGGSVGGVNSGYSGSYATTFINANQLHSSNISSPNLNFNALGNPALFAISNNAPNINLQNIVGKNINFSYLYETNPLFNQNLNFLTSEYFFTHLNYSPSRQIIMLGDHSAERKIVADTIAKTGMVQYLGDSAIDGLYANGLEYLKNNQDKIGYELSHSQVETLTKDMIIPFEKEINGKMVMVPQIYYSGATLTKAQEMNKAGGQIVAGNSLIITADGNITNKGYIGANNNLSLLTQGDFNNIGGEIDAGKNLSITANNILLDALTADSTTKPRTVTPLSFFGNRTLTIANKAKSSQIQNVSKINAGESLIINANNNFTAKGALIEAKKNIAINAGGSVSLGASYSNSSFDAGDTKETSAKSVNTIIQTGTQDSTPKLIQKAENDKKVENLNIDLAKLTKQKNDLENLLKDPESEEFMQAFLYPESSQAKLESLNLQIKDKQKQVADLKSKNQNLLASIANATGGDISINANKDIAIEAGSDSKTSYYHRSSSDFFGSTTTTKETQSQQVISALISGNNVNISSNQDVNVLASIITGGGDGNVSANNNLNINALQNMYYNYNFHQETQMDIGALALQITVAVALGAATGGVGFAALGVAGGFMAGATAGAIAASKAVATQYGMSAVASGGKGGTEQIQSGDADSTTTRSSTLITSSLLFGGNLALGAGGNINTQTANIKANNVSQEVKQSSTTSQISTHTDIEPDYGSIAKGAAVTGVIAGGTVVAGEYISKVKAKYLAEHPEAAKWMKQGNSNLKSGTMENSKVGVNLEKNINGEWIKEGSMTAQNPTGIKTNWFETYVTGSENPALQASNLKPGMPSGSFFHDALNLATPWNELSIIPALTLSDFSACGALCAGVITSHITETQKDTTTNAITIKN